ncbi:MAG: hypothetical protein QY310_03340 [Candidatus Jettenia sp. CY-1]|nr:MAG: hypothetical protein QY310_03340 [Candidatus Jettenia sp. CY-1]
MNRILTNYLKLQLEERKIPKEFLFDALDNPDEIVPSDKEQEICHKII